MPFLREAMRVVSGWPPNDLMSPVAKIMRHDATCEDVETLRYHPSILFEIRCLVVDFSSVSGFPTRPRSCNLQLSIPGVLLPEAQVCQEMRPCLNPYIYIQ
jgi:hypothetical protein